MPALELPEIAAPPSSPVLTLNAGLKAFQDPESVPANIFAEASSLLEKIGSLVSLDSRTGNRETPSLTVTAFGIAPSSDLDNAFTTQRAAAQNALRRGADTARLRLPAHFIVPGVGRGAYVYFATDDLARFRTILEHARPTFEDLHISNNPPIHGIALAPSAVAIAPHLQIETSTLLRKPTTTGISPHYHEAFTVALSTHARSILIALTPTPHSPTARPLHCSRCLDGHLAPPSHNEADTATAPAATSRPEVHQRPQAHSQVDFLRDTGHVLFPCSTLHQSRWFRKPGPGP